MLAPQPIPLFMLSQLVTKKMLLVSEEIKAQGGECLAALHTDLSSCRCTLSADESISLPYPTEAKQFPHEAPAPPPSRTPALAPPRPSPRPPLEKLYSFRAPQLVRGPTEPRLPGTALAPAGTLCRPNRPEPFRGGRARPHRRTEPRRLQGRDPRPSPFPRGPRGRANCGREGARTARQGPQPPPARPAARTGIRTRTSVAHAPPRTCPPLPTRGTLPPGAVRAAPSRRAEVQGSATRGGTGTPLRRWS